MKEHFGKYLGPTLVDEKEPLTAWRTWRLARKGGAAALVGTWATDFMWEPHGVTVAKCLAKERACNLSMREKCNCGLWAAAALSNLLAHGAVGLYPVGALGRVHLWGFVHVYEFGFRASMGQPIELWLGSSAGGRMVRDLHNAYGVPVALGLPVEVVSDPDLLPATRVRRAAEMYRAKAAPTTTHRLLEITIPLNTPGLANAGRKCSGCGTPGTRRDRCVKCNPVLAQKV